MHWSRAQNSKESQGGKYSHSPSRTVRQELPSSLHLCSPGAARCRYFIPSTSYFESCLQDTVLRALFEPCRPWFIWCVHCGVMHFRWEGGRFILLYRFVYIFAILDLDDFSQRIY